MLKVRIDEILVEQNHTKYWLYKQLEPMSYQNFNKIYTNSTSSIKFATLEKLSDVLNVPIGDLFKKCNEDKVIELQ